MTFSDYFARIAEIAGGRGPRSLPRPVIELAGKALEAWARVRGGPPAFHSRSATFIDRRGTVSIERAREELGWSRRCPWPRACATRPPGHAPSASSTIRMAPR